MNIFVAGATGAIGRVLVRQLANRGHYVVGMTRNTSKIEMLQALGAVPVVADAFDPDAVGKAVGRAEPDVIVHQLTALSDSLNERNYNRLTALTNRLQTMADRGGDYATTEYLGEIRMAELPEERAGRAGGRILVADDREYIREFLKDFLVLEGFRVDTASDGEEALSKVRSASYDLVLSDIKMPRRNGYEVFAGVRERDPRTKVILMTAYGYDPSHSIVRATGEGLSAVLYKPFQMSRVRDAIVKALSANGGGKGDGAPGCSG